MINTYLLLYSFDNLNAKRFNEFVKLFYKSPNALRWLSYLFYGFFTLFTPDVMRDSSLMD